MSAPYLTGDEQIVGPEAGPPLPPRDRAADRGMKLTLIILAAALIALLLIALPAWFWHPLGVCTTQVVRCKGYNFWSGAAGSFLTSLPGWAVALALFLHQRNCHQHGCWRLAWHPHPDHGHPVCKHHHPHDPTDLPSSREAAS